MIGISTGATCVNYGYSTPQLNNVVFSFAGGIHQFGDVHIGTRKAFGGPGTLQDDSCKAGAGSATQKATIPVGGLMNLQNTYFMNQNRVIYPDHHEAR